MSQTPALPPPPRLITDASLVGRLLDSYSQGPWPAGLSRFKLFSRARDKKPYCYRPVTWDAKSRSMYVLRLVAGYGTPVGPGHWERWYVDSPDRPLDDVHLISEDLVTPSEIRNLSQPLRDSSNVGLERRTAIVQAYSFVDIEHNDNKLRLFNPFVLSDPSERAAALRHVYESMGQKGGYQTTILQLFHRYCAYGGVERALARRTDQQGAPDVSRVGINKRRPGAESDKEAREKLRAVAFGEEPSKRVGPCRPLDIKKFVDAIVRFHIDDGLSLAATYAMMVKEHYAKYAKRLIPGIDRFFYHAREHILEKTDANGERLGPTLKQQYAAARTGQSSYMTFDMRLEIVDIDGFVCKLPIAAEINGKIEKIPLVVIFAVSRRTGAVVGYELALKGERSESFRRCIANVYIDKRKRARELGLTDMRGFVHGSIDGVFVDNGAGAAKDFEAACKKMELIKYFAPPRRGDLKAVGESLNNVMVLLMLQLAGAYSRRHDIFSEELRKIKSKDDPITVEQFEAFLLMAIQHINRFSNKRHLRVAAMREGRDRATIHPDSMWRWYQNRRRGDQHVELTEEQAWERFIPWKSATVRNGTVRRFNLRWKSDELKLLYEQHLRQRANRKTPFRVDIKRVGCHATKLQWRIPGTSIRGDLGLTEEDALRVENRTWRTWQEWNSDDNAQEKSAQIPKARSRSNLITVDQQKMVDDNRRRLGKPTSTIFSGKSVADARRNAAIKQDAHRFSSSAEEGTPVTEIDMATASVIIEGNDTIILPSETQIDYGDDLAARLRAAAEARASKR